AGAGLHVDLEGPRVGSGMDVIDAGAGDVAGRCQREVGRVHAGDGVAEGDEELGVAGRGRVRVEKGDRANDRLADPDRLAGADQAARAVAGDEQAGAGRAAGPRADRGAGPAGVGVPGDEVRVVEGDG